MPVGVKTYPETNKPRPSPPPHFLLKLRADKNAKQPTSTKHGRQASKKAHKQTSKQTNRTSGSLAKMLIVRHIALYPLIPVLVAV